MNNKKISNFLIIADILFILGIISLSFIHAERELRNWNGPGSTITTDLYIPSIMFACGEGFVNADPLKIPNLREFLDFKLPTFHKDNIPPDFTPLELDQYQQYHRYLIYTVGLLWRITGVSWESLRVFIAFLFTITTLITYLISRIYLIPPLAFIVALLFLRSPIPIAILPFLRDFARAPFILSSILLLCYISSRQTSNKKLLLLSVLIGVVNGIGLGFRRDQLLFFILSLFILVVPFYEKITFPNLLKRVVYSIVTLIVFVIISFPILVSFHRYGTLGYHDTLMGFGRESDELAGLSLPNYTRIPRYHDLLVYAIADVHSYYNSSLFEYDSNLRLNPENGKKYLLLSYLFWFPGDITIRIYSSVARILDKILTSALPINPYRLSISLLTLLLFITAYPKKALPFTFIILYSSAIQSLQFYFRHNFYLCFIPPLLQMLLLQLVITPFYFLIKEKKTFFSKFANESLFFIMRFIRNSTIATVILLSLLLITRTIQTSRVEKLFNTYLTSELTTVPFEKYPNQDENATIYALTKPLYTFIDKKLEIEPSFVVNHLVVDFNVSTPTVCFDVVYEGEIEFSCTLPIFIRDNNSPIDYPIKVRYFIPIFESFFNINYWNRFIGIKVEDRSGLEVMNIYKICNEDRIPLPLFFYIPEAGEVQTFQRIEKYTKERKIINPCWRPYGTPKNKQIIKKAIQDFKNGFEKEAIDSLKEAHNKEPYSIEYLLHAGILLEGKGNLDIPLEIYLELLRKKPYEAIVANYIDDLLKKQQLDSKQIEATWEKICKEVPESPIAHIFCSIHTEDREKAKREFLTAIETFPEISISTPTAAKFLSIKEIFNHFLYTKNDPTKVNNNTILSRCSKLSLRKQISLLISAVSILETTTEYDKCLEIAKLLLDICPELPHIYPPLICVYKQGSSPNPVLATYYAKTLVELQPYKIEPITSLEQIYENTQFIPVNEWIAIWKDIERKYPKSPCILCGTGRALEKSGDYKSAEEYFIRAIRKGKRDNPCVPLAYYRLIKLYLNQSKKEEAYTLLKKALKHYPDNPSLLELQREM